MKQQLNVKEEQQPRLQLVYASNKELAAVHLITPQGIISYASLGTVPRPKKQAS